MNGVKTVTCTGDKVRSWLETMTCGLAEMSNTWRVVWWVVGGVYISDARSLLSQREEISASDHVVGKFDATHARSSKLYTVPSEECTIAVGRTGVGPTDLRRCLFPVALLCTFVARLSG